ncbi:Potential acrAB operon repressor [Staphylococcus piscifermentans]|uniref:TetR family transcriptional regulator n=1 Tax=Staphylococcus piscifermentans TaxID=70258 RepID=A0A239TJI2_9STAP|nr:TetR/AcrR family transcriptional regulator [Staphylococcus piscifermentans]RTX86764.1 TetR/AcrR family transcriptional regulator [Staphylococcus piscifermentans]GEP84493.1 TetR family transcriptional regulator [Staphylococcus piscifermentans]SNU97917.1 Potential acrAB operon repressor [Staphylococcus piscifermentans]
MAITRNYEETHKKLLDVSLKNFLESGFEQTKLRQICRDAEVTTGAFYKHFKNKEEIFEEIVMPLIIKLKEAYQNRYTDFFEFNTKQDVVKKWADNNDEMYVFIDLFYDNYDVFTLLFFNAQGTKYENMLEKVTQYSEENTHKFYKVLFPNSEPLNKEKVHFYTYAYFAAMLDVLRHQFSREKTKELSTDLHDFVLPGWFNFMNIKSLAN